MLIRTPPQRPTNSRAGFTLTEMLVVVAIIVVLAGIAVPITMSVLSDSKKSIAQAHIKGTLVPAVQRYRMKHNEQLPQSLEELITDPSAGLKPEALIDPWNRPYQLQPADNGDGCIISSGGPNGNEIISNVSQQ